MTITVKQHIPGFVDGVEPSTRAASNLEEFLLLPFVEHWRKLVGFNRYSLSIGEKLLMAEMNDGKFWVVAYLSDIPAWLSASLPEWKGRQ